MAPLRPPEVHRAIVLAVHNAGESHRVVQVLSERQGRLALWARHARGSRRRFAGALEPFGTAELLLAPRGTLQVLQSAQVLRARGELRQDLARLGRAARLCNVVRHLWPEQQAAPEIFVLLGVALDHLNDGAVARAAGLYPRLLHHAGLLPDPRACGACGAALPPLVLPAPAATGSVAGHEPRFLCPRCAPGRPPLPEPLAQALAGARITTAATAAAMERLVLGWLALTAHGTAHGSAQPTAQKGGT